MSSTQGLLADTVELSYVDGPGARFVVFLQGCNFDCLACHNPQTIDVRGGPTCERTDVGKVVERIRRAAPFLRGVTVSGGEATLQWRFVRDLFAALAADPELARLTRFVDSNGAVPPAVWDELEPVMDAAMIDLKCLDPAIHRMLTGQPNDRVLATIRRLAAHGKLHEVRLLVIGGVNDRADLLRRTAAELAAIDPRMRVKVIAFSHHGVRPSPVALREPTRAEVEAAGEILRGEAGLQVEIVAP